MSLSREAMIEALMWGRGGCGFGPMLEGVAMFWAMDEPSRTKPDLPSIVEVTGPPEKYSDEELAALLEFSRSATARYDRLQMFRRGANLILIDKQDNGRNWMRKRMTWQMGSMFSPSLEEAIRVMEK